MLRRSASLVAAAVALSVVPLPLLPTAHAQGQGQGRTAFEFSRNVETCDPTEGADLPLAGTTRVIYAWNNEDPPVDVDGSGEAVPAFHGANHGTQSVALVGANPEFPIVEETETFELRMDRTMLNPSPLERLENSTLYYCKIFELPDEDYHVVKFDMLIPEENLPYVHHALVYECPQAEGVFRDTETGGDGTSLVGGIEAECPIYNALFWLNTAGTGHSLVPCNGQNVVWAWAIGGGANTLPPNIGLPIGPGTNSRYLFTEIHYDFSVDGRTELMDNSGIELTVTKDYREIEAGISMLGALTAGRGPNQLLIPPNEQDFEVPNWCPKEALADQISATPDQEINFLSVFLHAHLAGRRIRLDQYRDGAGLGNIIDDKTYDFNYQTTQFLEEPVKMLPEDDLLLTCWFDTTNRDDITVGGGSSEQEMCLAFVMYWPRLPNGASCLANYMPRHENGTTIEDFDSESEDAMLVLHGGGFPGSPISAFRSFNSSFPSISSEIVDPDVCAGATPTMSSIYSSAEFASLRDIGNATDVDLDQWRESFDHSMALRRDDSYTLYWTYYEANSTNDGEVGTVRFGIDVATEGWAGLGFSPNGGMINGDMIMAWVDDAGVVHFDDRHAPAESLPQIDAQQDFFDVSGVQYIVEDVTVPVPNIDSESDSESSEEEVDEEGVNAAGSLRRRGDWSSRLLQAAATLVVGYTSSMLY